MRRRFWLILRDGLAKWAFLLCLMASFGLLSSSVWAASRAGAFKNIVNEPFATVADGPLCTYQVTLEPGVDKRLALRRAGSELSRQYSAPAVRRLVSFLQKHRPDIWQPRFTELVLLSEKKQPIWDRNWGRAGAERIGGGEIQFEYVGWTAGDQSALQDFVERLYPVAKEIYGQPAFTLTVKIVQDPEVHDLLGGFYVVSTHEIHLPPLSGNFSYDSFVLTQLILHSFRDAALLFYDSWEKGMVRAAALLCQTQIDPDFQPLREPFYLMPLYDLLNQAPLGNCTFYPSSGYAAMFPFRVGMAAAAWLKVAAEHPNFFRDFNRAYYAALNPEEPAELAGNIPALRDLAASAAPQVEGKSFHEWYEGQYVLDTSVSLGRKFFIYNLPRENSLLLVVNYYSTDWDGDESPQGGEVALTYWDFTHVYSLFAQEGYTINIPASGSDAGQGFLAPTFFNIGGSQRVFVDLSIGNLLRTLYFPYSSEGNSGTTNALFGAIVGDNQGQVSVEMNGSLVEGEASQGVYFLNLPPPIQQPSTIRLCYINSFGQEVIEQRNVAYGYYILQVRNAARQQLFSHHFSRGSNGLHLISIPFLPADPSPPQVLGLPPEHTLLAEWQPSLVEDQRYKIYPELASMAPGHGYWLKIFEDLDIDTLGTPLTRDVSFRVELEPGWNMLGNPFNGTIPIEQLQFQRGEEGPLTFQAAVGLGWISPSIWSYSQVMGYVSVERMQPWEGYWLLVTVEEGVVVFIPPPE